MSTQTCCEEWTDANLKSEIYLFVLFKEGGQMRRSYVRHGGWLTCKHHEGLPSPILQPPDLLHSNSHQANQNTGTSGKNLKYVDL